MPAPRTHPLHSSTSGGWLQSGSSLGSSSLPATVNRGTRAAMPAEPTIMLKLPVLPSPLPRSVPFQSLYRLCPKKDRFKLRASLGCMTDSCSLYAQPWLEQFPSSCLRCVNQKPDALTARYSVCLKKIQDKLWKGCAFSNSFSKTVLI